MTKKTKNKKKNKKTRSSSNPQKSHKELIIKKELLKQAISKSNIDDQYERIYKILGLEDVKDENRAAVNYGNLEKFLAYLKNETTFPIIVTGIEDMGCFGWEEYYNLGPGSKREYEKLKKKYPSFKDKYELLCFNENFDDEEGLCVEVLRIDDKKKFTLTLADLETVEKKSKNAQLLDDYAVWHTNFRI
jgi:hypothetical protein